jgi:hypothetical protein
MSRKSSEDKGPNRIFVAALQGEGEARGAWAYLIRARRGHTILQAGSEAATTKRSLQIHAVRCALGRLPKHEGDVAVLLPDEALAEELRGHGETVVVPSAQEDIGFVTVTRPTRLARMLSARPIAWARPESDDDEEGMAEARRLAAEEFRKAFGGACAEG